MELTSYRSRIVKRMTTHHDRRTNAGKAVVIEFEEGDRLMVAVDTRNLNNKLDMFIAPPGSELPWPPDSK